MTESMNNAKWLDAGREKPNVVILMAPSKPHVAEAFTWLEPAITRHAKIVAVDREFAYGFGDPSIDLVIVLGGDGSILQAARQMEYSQYPVLGVNLGRLGFLAALQPKRFVELWPSICAGEFQLSQHLMFVCEIYRNGIIEQSRLGLNETALLGGPPYAMLRIEMHVDGMLATTYSCDGLIISTPIGSTAHNLSAGGPILQNLLQAFVISPISPHALTMRPVVDTAERVFQLRILEEHATCSVVVDGRVIESLTPNHMIQIRRADAQFQMVSLPGQDDYATLREKLGWSGSPKTQW